MNEVGVGPGMLATPLATNAQVVNGPFMCRSGVSAGVGAIGTVRALLSTMRAGVGGLEPSYLPMCSGPVALLLILSISL